MKQTFFLEVESPTLKVIKNALPNKKGYPESLKNNHNNWNIFQLMYK